MFTLKMITLSQDLYWNLFWKPIKLPTS